MTDNEINAAIAECLGIPFDVCKCGEVIESHTQGHQEHGFDPVVNINFCVDLNAMHEAEKTLLKLANKGREFILHLWEVTGLQKLRGPLLLHTQSPVNEFHLQADKIWELWVTATPRQRAEAFLRAKGIWKD